jgi:hypothetical protein
MKAKKEREELSFRRINSRSLWSFRGDGWKDVFGRVVILTTPCYALLRIIEMKRKIYILSVSYLIVTSR